MNDLDAGLPIDGSGTWLSLFAAGWRAVGGSRQRVWSMFPSRCRVYGPRGAATAELDP